MNSEKTATSMQDVELAEVPGNVESVELTPDATTIGGWLLGTADPIDRVLVRLNGEPLGEVDPLLREDVAAAFPHAPHAARSGVLIRARPVRVEAPLRIEFVGRRGGRDLVKYEQFWLIEKSPYPAPRRSLVQRIGSDDADGFRQDGYNIAARLVREARNRVMAPRPVRLLDWGCGSGRVTQFLPELWPGARVTGCDIDGDAVAWCKHHIPGAKFHVTGPFPPLPFESASFDVALGSSVMTHLTAAVQSRWLQEIHRVLAPGGVLVASALSLGAPKEVQDKLRDCGIVDQRDPVLDGIAPKDYYRITWQTEEFTRRHWGEMFDILAYRQAGLGTQDLVVMRRKPGRATEAPAERPNKTFLQNWLKRLLG